MYSYQHKVQYYETDQMGIVHHSNYIRWMEEARIDFLSQIGCDYKTMEGMGIISPVVSVECKYKASALFGDLVSISVWIEEFRGVKLKVAYKMTRGVDTLLCTGRSEHCFLEDGYIINLKRTYPELYQALHDHVKED